MRQDRKQELGRRQFFRALGGGAVVTAAAAASPLTATDAQAYDPGSDQLRSLYRVTPDVKAFYRTNAYETLPDNVFDKFIAKNK
ncbi:formate dehydrogenase [Hansschlegelia beijingensis]|uniref:formate dehydrogenase n=1 Tax=Hansschlegelia beijingensis TaxID=1133344 RepID=UPI00387F2365